MGFLFGKSKVKTPSVPAPAVLPDTKQADAASDDAMRAARKRAGLAKTVITGDLSPSTGAKTALG
jgi:hypothetical protein